MENNFYVGVDYHRKKLLKQEYNEKLVLYSDDGYNYIDLLNNNLYTINENELEYVIKETLIPTNPLDYKEDYMYLLTRYKTKTVSKKRKLLGGK